MCRDVRKASEHQGYPNQLRGAEIMSENTKFFLAKPKGHPVRDM